MDVYEMLIYSVTAWKEEVIFSGKRCSESASNTNGDIYIYRYIYIYINPKSNREKMVLKHD